jgi:hypothetical protein
MGSVCGGGCGSAGPRCQVSTLAGIRYLRVDDDFLYRSEWERMDTNGTGWHQYNVEVDNQLVGFQIGANGAYYMGACRRFGLHCYSNAGIYGNRAEVSQWMDSSSGMTRYANNGNPGSYTNSDDTNVAFLGELRLGASYQCTCNCRLYGGYRVLGITGVAVSYDQVPDYFSSPAQVGIINCRGSYFLHGMQTGIEFLY